MTLYFCRWHESYGALEQDYNNLKKSNSDLNTEYTELGSDYSKLDTDYTHIWEDYLALHMLACDAVFPRPRFTQSPHTHKSIDMTTVKIIQHRLFTLMDSDEDGVISEGDVNTWVDTHIQLGTLDRYKIVRRKFEGKYVEAEFPAQEDWQLCEFVVERVWGMLKEMFSPQSQDARWKVNGPASDMS